MIKEERILQLIFESIEEANLLQEDNNRLEFTENTILIGKNSLLDSLGFVNLIVDLEQRVNETFNTQILLMDEKAMSAKNSPFRNVQTLTEYIYSLLKERENNE